MNDPKTLSLLVQKLRHDVGKYISRAARNMEGRSVTGPLLDLLLDDLFALDGGRRASSVFEETASPLEALIGKSPHIEACREMLRRIDALEPKIRAADEAAIREASALAVEIDNRLRGLKEEFARRAT